MFDLLTAGAVFEVSISIPVKSSNCYCCRHYLLHYLECIMNIRFIIYCLQLTYYSLNFILHFAPTIDFELTNVFDYCLLPIIYHFVEQYFFTLLFRCYFDYLFHC